MFELRMMKKSQPFPPRSRGRVVQVEESLSTRVIKPVWPWALSSWMGQENQGQRTIERRHEGREDLVFQSFRG